MIELSRGHGHFDPRCHTRSRPRALVLAAKDCDRSIERWENEGGRYSRGDESGAQAGLAWYAFRSRYLPERDATTSRHSRRTKLRADRSAFRS